MLLFSHFFGFLILVTITTISHALPKDIHIYLHGLGKSANNPTMIYPPRDDDDNDTPLVEAGKVETSTEASEGGGEDSNRSFDDDGCPPIWANRNSYKLLGPLITRQSPCSGNSPKIPSPIRSMQPFAPIAGPNPGCSPPCSGNTPFEIPWPKILPRFTPPPPTTPPRIVTIPWIKTLPRFTPPPPRSIPGWNPELPGCLPPCTGISQMIIPPTAPPRLIYPPFDDHEPPPFNVDWNINMPGCSPPCNGNSPPFKIPVPVLPMPKPVYPPFDDHSPPPYNLQMPGCSPPCDPPILPMPPKPIGMLPQQGCSPPCSGDSGKGKFWSEFVKSTSGNLDW